MTLYWLKFILNHLTQPRRILKTNEKQKSTAIRRRRLHTRFSSTNTQFQHYLTFCEHENLNKLHFKQLDNRVLFRFRGHRHVRRSPLHHDARRSVPLREVFQKSLGSWELMKLTEFLNLRWLLNFWNTFSFQNNQRYLKKAYGRGSEKSPLLRAWNCWNLMDLINMMNFIW